MTEDSNINHLSPLGSSKHEILLWNVICYLEITGSNFERKKWNYPNDNIPAMNQFFAKLIVNGKMFYLATM